jgi:hypothetical protein
MQSTVEASKYQNELKLKIIVKDIYILHCMVGARGAAVG